MSEKKSIKLSITKTNIQPIIDEKKAFMISYNLDQKKLISDYILNRVRNNESYNFNQFFIDGIHLLKEENPKIENKIEFPKGRNSRIKTDVMLKRTTIYLDFNLIYWLNGFIFNKIESSLTGIYSKYDLVKDICKIMNLDNDTSI